MSQEINQIEPQVSGTSKKQLSIRLNQSRVTQHRLCEQEGP